MSSYIPPFLLKNSLKSFKATLNLLKSLPVPYKTIHIHMKSHTKCPLRSRLRVVYSLLVASLPQSAQRKWKSTQKNVNSLFARNSEDVARINTRQATNIITNLCTVGLLWKLLFYFISVCSLHKVNKSTHNREVICASVSMIHVCD